MSKIALVATGSALVLGWSVIVASPASASGCVTRTEYKHVHKGQTITKVKSIFHGYGGHREARSVSGGYGTQVRNYRTCQPYSAVSISFSKSPGGVYRVDAKTAVWTD